MLNQFIFFRNQYEALQDMPKDVQADVLMSIAGYMLDDKQPDSEISGTALALFRMIKPSLDVSKARAEAGRRGGKANSKQNGSKTEAIKNKEQGIKNEELRNKNKETSIPSTHTNNDSGECVCGDRSSPAGSFEDFWNSYPRQVSRKAAEDVWGNPDEATVKEIMEGLARHKKAWEGIEARYIPYPATWLSQERWKDEISSVKSPTNSGSASIDRSKSNGVPGQHEIDSVQRLVRRHRKDTSNNEDGAAATPAP